MPVKKQTMTQMVNESIRSKEFQPEQQWGPKLMRLYALQIDRAELVRQEVLSIIKESDTASKTWHQRLLQMEKYVNAESMVNSTGPKLLVLMKEFGMTPTLLKVKRGGETNDGGQEDQGEDELAALRNQRRAHASGS
jgi:hypothetical protein